MAPGARWRRSSRIAVSNSRATNSANEDRATPRRLRPGRSRPSATSDPRALRTILQLRRRDRWIGYRAIRDGLFEPRGDPFGTALGRVPAGSCRNPDDHFPPIATAADCSASAASSGSDGWCLRRRRLRATGDAAMRTSRATTRLQRRQRHRHILSVVLGCGSPSDRVRARASVDAIFVGQLLAQPGGGARAGFFNLRLVDVLHGDRHIGDDLDAARRDLDEPFADGLSDFASPLPSRSRPARFGDEVFVERIHAHLALDAGERHHLDIAGSGDRVRRGHSSSKSRHAEAILNACATSSMPPFM